MLSSKKKKKGKFQASVVETMVCRFGTCVPDGKLEFFATNANHLHLEVNT
jgi:hypothetical protein